MSETKIKPAELSIEEQEKKEVAAFFEDYKKLTVKHGYDIGAVLDYGKNGIQARPQIIKLETEKVNKSKK